MKNKNLITILREGKDFELIEDLEFWFEDGLGEELKKRLGIYALNARGLKGDYICIPKGFRTDFGSIPQIFQSLISPVGKPTKSYVLHDYLLSLWERGFLDRKTCDAIFKEALRVQGVGSFKRNVMYGCVRIYGVFREIWRNLKFKKN